MGYPDTFEGFMITDQKKYTDFKKQEFKPKKFEEYDIDVKIECCGVCHSDVSTMSGEWGECPLPIACGHEIVGKAIKVGSKVTKFKVGDRVGVGAQVRACLECDVCKADQENYCPNMIDTYGAKYEDGTVSQGGYSSHIRAHEYFVFPIPDAIASEDAGPMMCAGLTVYSPLVRAGTGPGKKVAILGLGGLGHFAVLWAKALGAEVYVISHSAKKEADAKKLGAKEFINTTKKDWQKPYAYKFDFVLNTTNATHTFDLPAYLSTVSINGEFHNVGLPGKPLEGMKVQMLVPNGCKFSASHIGNRPEMLAMLKLASEKNIKPMIETIKIGEQGCRTAVERLENNDVKYRFTLTGYEEVFGQ